MALRSRWSSRTVDWPCAHPESADPCAAMLGDGDLEPGGRERDATCARTDPTAHRNVRRPPKVPGGRTLANSPERVPWAFNADVSGAPSREAPVQVADQELLGRLPS